MRNNKADARTFSIVLLLLMLGAGLCSAQKMVERGTDTIRITTAEERDPGRVEIEITTGEDSSRKVIVRGGHDEVSANNTSIVRVGENVRIEPGQVVEGDVVAVGGSIRVLGHVKGDAVAVGGGVELSGDGAVDGDAVAIGGSVVRPSGTRVGGENIGMRFVPSFIFGSLHSGGSVLWTLLGTMAKLLFLFFVAWLLVALAEKRVRFMGQFVEIHLWKSLFTGLAVLILFPIAFVLLLVTIVGIPLALLSPLALMVSLLVGYLVVAGLLGHRVLSGGPQDRNQMIKSILIGLLVFEAVPLFGHLLRAAGTLRSFGLVLGVFGYAAIFISAAIGLGSLVLTRFGYRTPPETMTTTTTVTTEPSPA